MSSDGSAEIAAETAESASNKEKSDDLGKSEADEVKNALREAQEKSAEYLNRLKYLQADFLNYQKRVKKDIEEAYTIGAERLMGKLLGVVDDLERAVEATKSEKTNPLSEGVQMVMKELSEILRQEGVTPIEAVGKPFNPNMHEVVLQVETNDHEDNTILEELRKGYKLNDRVIRTSIVKVSKSPAPPIQTENSTSVED
ncbi:MAG: nucleotide exchange factor GrpE [Candidatus Bathyarchaeia archaeon]